MADPEHLGDTAAPLRGREDEYAAVTAALDEARHGGRCAVVVVGAGGTGKTRLLRTVLADAARSWTSMATVLDGADVGWDVPPASTDGLDVSRLVVVDNAHLGDPERLESLTHTALAGRTNGSLLMVAGRPGRSGVTTEWFRGRTCSDTVTIRLGPLSDAAVRDMIADLTGGRPSDALAALAAQADGNPRLVRELVTGLREERRLRVTGGRTNLTGAHIPERVVVLVRRRLDQLSLRCRQLLQVAAILGRTLRLGVISETLREPTASTLPSLEEAISADLLDVRGERLVFQSTLVWRAVRGTVPAPIRLALEHEFGAMSVDADHDEAQPPPAVGDAPATPAGETLNRLNPTERAIAELVSAGLTNRQIAAQVYLSPHTVNYHLRRIYRKLDVASRVELAILAKSDGD
ncbi:helix-turn-helix transcriptional regulator [Actinophytocola sp.]|uniref:helix-turn-helix transcriptional regulator n=1 Tax=Actinophytocola sp. TaxID=1872138 RepID=UPI002ED5F5E5